MIRLKYADVYVITSFYYDVAKGAFLKLYRHCERQKILVKPTTSSKQIFRYTLYNIHGGNVSSLLKATDIVAPIISKSVRKITKKEYVGKYISSHLWLMPIISWQRDLLGLIGHAMVKRAMVTIFIDRPESRLMPPEQVVFTRALAALDRELKNNTVTVVILTTSSYMLYPRKFRVYFVSKDGNRYKFEKRPLKAFAVADLML